MAQLTAVQNRQKQFSMQLATMANAKLSEIGALFGGNMGKAEKFVTDLKLLALNRGISDCNAASVFTTALSAAQLGLSIVPQKKEAYVVPYKGVAQLQIGYVGWLKLAQDSGLTVKCHLVYTVDEFDVEYEMGDLKITFKPNIVERNDADPVWVETNLKAAVVVIKNTATGSVDQHFVNADTLRKIKAQNPAVSKGSSSPWTTWAAEMYSAKAIKYVTSKQPMGDNFSMAVSLETDSELASSKVAVLDQNRAVNEDNGLEMLNSFVDEPEPMAVNGVQQSNREADLPNF